MPAIVAFYCADGTWSDRLVRWGSWSRFSHVELVGAREGDGYRCISASKRDGSCVRETVIEFKPGHWQFLSLPFADGARAWVRARAHLGAPYDTLGAGLSILPPALGRARALEIDARFCSWIVGDALGVPDAWSMTPGELYAHFRRGYAVACAWPEVAHALAVATWRRGRISPEG